MIVGAERERRARVAASEIERKRTAKKIARLVERVAKKGEPFRRSETEEHPFATPRVLREGRRYTSPVLTASVWTETTRSYGVGSDDIANFARQTKKFEVREGGRTVFEASAHMQSNYEGGPLKLTVDPKDWTWYLLAYVKRGTWEENLRKLATSPVRKGR